MTFWPALRGVTAFPAFPAHETRKQSYLDAQPIEKIMVAVEVSVVAMEHVCCCPGAIRDRPGCRWYLCRRKEGKESEEGSFFEMERFGK